MKSEPFPNASRQSAKRGCNALLRLMYVRPKRAEVFFRTSQQMLYSQIFKVLLQFLTDASVAQTVERYLGKVKVVSKPFFLNEEGEKERNA